MAEGGARRSGRTRTKSLKAELIAASEERQRSRRKLTSSSGQLTGTPSEPDELEEQHEWSEGSCELEEVGVVSGKPGESGESEGGVGEGIRKSVRKRKQVELFDPSAVSEELSVRRVKGRQGLEADSLGDDVLVQPRWVGPVGDPKGAESTSGRSGGVSSSRKPPRTTKTAAEPETVRQRRQRQASDSSRACSEDSDGPTPSAGPEGGAWLPSEGCWAHLEELCAVLPGRRTQVETLLTLWGEPSSPVCPTLFVYGHSGTGKTLVLQTVLGMLELPHALVNCAECYSSRLLYEAVLNRFSGVVPSQANGYSSHARCDNMATFVRLLPQVINSKGLSNQTSYIVLDKAERLRDMEATVLPALLRLSELTHCRVCVVLVSEVAWGNFYMDTGSAHPLHIHFPSYSKAETLEIMARDRPPSHPLPPSLFHTFTHHIWNVFQAVCRDLGELRHLSSLLFPKYCEPVESGEVASTETRKLWRHIEPYFRSVMSRIYLRELSSSQWERVQSSVDGRDPSSLRQLAEGLSPGCSPLELPSYSKFLLVAGYLASYNPARTDRRFFSKLKQSRSRKSKRALQKEKPNCQLLGPKAFPLDRMMAIFYSIVEEPVTPAADIYSQITSLVTLQLLAQVSSRDAIDSPKYKCLVTLDFIRQVARSVGFDVLQYLYDFT